jgi:bifunctional N-acetylglucosamine-1-phosphate-uridyltransferase/glucosamine-1-phosphate-acetyltransferase GlmU-like protein
MKDITVEVVGVDPPCKRCQATLKNVEEAASALKASGFDIHVPKLNMVSKDVIAKYGVVVSPSLAINGVVRIARKVQI